MIFSQYVVDALKMSSAPFTRPFNVAWLLAHNSTNIYIFNCDNALTLSLIF
jgi:hypothetical protein